MCNSSFFSLAVGCVIGDSTVEHGETVELNCISWYTCISTFHSHSQYLFMSDFRWFFSPLILLKSVWVHFVHVFMYMHIHFVMYMYNLLFWNFHRRQIMNTVKFSIFNGMNTCTCTCVCLFSLTIQHMFVWGTELQPFQLYSQCWEPWTNVSLAY